MSTIEEVRNLQQQGVGEEQIIRTLRDKGTSYKDIADALAQTRIKAAVEQPDADPSSQYDGSQTPEGMQASIMGPSQDFQDSQQQQEEPVPSPNQPYMPQIQEYPQQQYDQYPQYNSQYSAPAPSSDVMTEVAEQVVAEKLSEVRKHLEKVIDLKTTFETKLDSVDDRLKRIEKVIDTLQSSVLRKVGDYVTNVQDLKTELIETQKTFAKLTSQKHSQNTHSNQQQSHSHQHHHSTHQHNSQHHQHKKK